MDSICSVKYKPWHYAAQMPAMPPQVSLGQTSPVPISRISRTPFAVPIPSPSLSTTTAHSPFSSHMHSILEAIAPCNGLAIRLIVTRDLLLPSDSRGSGGRLGKSSLRGKPGAKVVSMEFSVRVRRCEYAFIQQNRSLADPSERRELELGSWNWKRTA